MWGLNEKSCKIKEKVVFFKDILMDEKFLMEILIMRFFFVLLYDIS